VRAQGTGFLAQDRIKIRKQVHIKNQTITHTGEHSATNETAYFLRKPAGKSRDNCKYEMDRRIHDVMQRGVGKYVEETER